MRPLARRRPPSGWRRRAAHVGVDDVAVEHGRPAGRARSTGRATSRHVDAVDAEAAVEQRRWPGPRRTAGSLHLGGRQRAGRRGPAPTMSSSEAPTDQQRGRRPAAAADEHDSAADDGQHPSSHTARRAPPEIRAGSMRRGGSCGPSGRTAEHRPTSLPATLGLPAPARPPPRLVDPLLRLGVSRQDQPRPHAVGRRQATVANSATSTTQARGPAAAPGAVLGGGEDALLGQNPTSGGTPASDAARRRAGRYDSACTRPRRAAPAHAVPPASTPATRPRGRAAP